MICFVAMAQPKRTHSAPTLTAPRASLSPRRRPRPIASLAHRPFIVHGEVAWAQTAPWPQHLFLGLAQHHPVLWITDPDFMAVASPELRIKPIHPNIVQVVPILPRDHAINSDQPCATLAPLLRAALATHPMMRGRFNEAIQWFRSSKTAGGFFGDFGTIGALYEWTAHDASPGYNDHHAREHFLFQAAPLIWPPTQGAGQLKSSTPAIALPLLATDAPAGAARSTQASPQRGPVRVLCEPPPPEGLWDQQVASLRAQVLDTFRPPATASLPQGFVAASALAWAAD
jgi:hypothetical protein